MQQPIIFIIYRVFNRIESVCLANTIIHYELTKNVIASLITIAIRNSNLNRSLKIVPIEDRKGNPFAYYIDRTYQQTATSNTTWQTYLQH